MELKVRIALAFSTTLPRLNRTFYGIESEEFDSYHGFVLVVLIVPFMELKEVTNHYSICAHQS